MELEVDTLKIAEPQQPLPHHSHQRRALRLPRLPQAVQGGRQVGRAQEEVLGGRQVRLVSKEADELFLLFVWNRI